MNIVYFGNTLNKHQVYVSDVLYEKTGHNYIYVETVPPKEENLSGGKLQMIRPYVFRAYESISAHNKALDFSCDADVAIFGAFSLPYEIERLRKTQKLSFEVSERWLKRGWMNIFSPRLLSSLWHYHTDGWAKKPLYKLCSSAFCANDQYKLLTFKGRCYKWGYFTEVKQLDIENIIGERERIEGSSDGGSSHKVTILWCARFLGLKHPELVVKLAQRLKANRFNVTIDMYGSGEELEPTQRLCEKFRVEDIIKFKGNVPNEEILQAMREHDIFIFTSDKNEGWGAVLNEAMSNGCTVVASDEIGSVPFLVKDGVNGYIFKSMNIDSLYEKVVMLIEGPTIRKKMAVQAYYDMVNVWSPRAAANNLLKLIDDLQHNRESSIINGPCSTSRPFSKI